MIDPLQDDFVGFVHKHNTAFSFLPMTMFIKSKSYCASPASCFKLHEQIRMDWACKSSNGTYSQSSDKYYKNNQKVTNRRARYTVWVECPRHFTTQRFCHRRHLDEDNKCENNAHGDLNAITSHFQDPYVSSAPVVTTLAITCQTAKRNTTNLSRTPNLQKREYI